MRCFNFRKLAISKCLALPYLGEGGPGDGGGGAEPEDVTTDHLSRVSASQRSRPRARLPLRLVITVFARRSRITRHNNKYES